jgi:hypothetical protein
MQSGSSTAPVSPADQSSSNPTPPKKTKDRGRPRTLDDAKRREICALVAGGCGLREAARYVRCNINTVRREAERNPEFDERLRSSQTYAQLSPLRAMQHAVGTHWRAAAWMLERAFPNRFSKPVPGAFGARQARELLNEALTVIHSEISDPFKYGGIERRLRGTFEYYIRAACDRRRTSRGLRRAMKFFDDRNTTPQPFSDFGVGVPDYDTLMSGVPTHSSPTQPSREARSPKSTRARARRRRSMEDVLEELRDRVAKANASEPASAPNPVPSNLNNQPTSDAPN